MQQARGIHAKEGMPTIRKRPQPPLLSELELLVAHISQSIMRANGICKSRPCVPDPWNRQLLQSQGHEEEILVFSTSHQL